MIDNFRNRPIPRHKQETLLEYTFIEAGKDNRNFNHYKTQHTNPDIKCKPDRSTHVLIFTYLLNC